MNVWLKKILVIVTWRNEEKMKNPKVFNTELMIEDSSFGSENNDKKSTSSNMSAAEGTGVKRTSKNQNGVESSTISRNQTKGETDDDAHSGKLDIQGRNHKLGKNPGEDGGEENGSDIPPNRTKGDSGVLVVDSKYEVSKSFTPPSRTMGD